MSFDDLDELDVDFDAADIEGRFLVEVKNVTVQQKRNENEGLTSQGIGVTFVIENDPTFEGQFVNKYFWLGSKDDDGVTVKKPMSQNIREFKNFVEAVTGVKPEGNVKLSAYSPEVRKIGKNEVTCLTDLEGGHAMITVQTETGKDGVERSVVKAISAFHGSGISEDDEEPF